ncbi:MAG: hypothetical protein KGO51_07875, partial [Alphaproteobacteria bacterium]|nr:hypothetical protein [Alphaproteobacteria bacterium]
MVQDGHDIEDVQDDPGGPAAEPVSRALLFGGVAVACALGAGLGLWARPIAGESPQAARPAVAIVPQAPVARRLHVVVDESPPPPSAPLEVMPSTPPPGVPVAPVLLAPRRPPNGLVRVDAPVPGPLALAPTPRSAPPAPPARPAARPVEVRTAKAEHARPAPKRHPQRLAKATVPKRPHRVEIAETRREHESEPRRALVALAHPVRRLAPHHAHQAERAEAGPTHKPVVRKAA